MQLVDSFLGGSDADRQAARRAIIEELGPAEFVDAAAVFGNFEMMNRIAEGTGIPVPPQMIDREAKLIRALGLDQMLKSQHRS